MDHHHASAGRLLVTVCCVISVAAGIGCQSPIPAPEQDDRKESGSGDDTSTPGPDLGTDTAADMTTNQPDSGGNQTEDSGNGDDDPDQEPEKIPNRITTNGGASFSNELAGGETETISLVANQNDFIVARMATESGNPALYLYRPQDDGSRQQLAYHDTQEAVAHIPYRDSDLSEGWEFYEGGEHILELRNNQSSPLQFDFELICKSGPCTDGGGNNGSSDSDGIPDDSDNCPNTDNAGQANQDGDIYGDACDPNIGQISCPAGSLDNPEQRIRAAYRNHPTQSYDQARQDLYSTVDNDNGSVETVYIGRTITTNGIPDPSEVNTEHTVPRSTISSQGAPFSDLHHLFPADSDVNSRRSNFSFDNVTTADWSSNGSKKGPNASGYTVFEPRDSKKGAVARAVFYFATVYDREISITKGDNGRGEGLANESTLRNWHNNVDPVSSADESRNEAVYQIQNTRNPFVDCPGLVSEINDF